MYAHEYKLTLRNHDVRSNVTLLLVAKAGQSLTLGCWVKCCWAGADGAAVRFPQPNAAKLFVFFPNLHFSSDLM